MVRVVGVENAKVKVVRDIRVEILQVVVVGVESACVEFEIDILNSRFSMH